MIEDISGCIDYDEAGAGPTVVLVPGSCSTGTAWRPVMAQWKNNYRVVTTSLLGYGGTQERRSVADTDIAHEAEALEAVIRRAGCPVHLVGHSFGGLCAVAVALRGRVPLLSLTIAEAPAPEILRHMGEYRHYLAFQTMSDAYFSAYHAGDNAGDRTDDRFLWRRGDLRRVAAARSRLRIANHAGQPAGLDQRLWVRPDARVACDDQDSDAGVVGRGQPSRRERANQLLGQFIPDAAVAAIAGAAHFMIATHAGEVAGMIAQQVRARKTVRWPLRRPEN